MVACLLLTGALVANKTITRCYLAPCDSFATSVCFGLSFSVWIAVNAVDCGSFCFCCNCYTLLVGGYLTPGAPARCVYMCGAPGYAATCRHNVHCWLQVLGRGLCSLCCFVVTYVCIYGLAAAAITCGRSCCKTKEEEKLDIALILCLTLHRIHTYLTNAASSTASHAVLQHSDTA
jgi:hypothetical protein